MSIDELWTTGITVRYESSRKRWTAAAKFFDGRFCDPRAVQGEVTLRYWVDDLGEGIAMLLRLLERLKIEVRSPYLYVEQDGEGDVDLPDNWQEILHQEAEKIGWEMPYALHE